MKTYGKELIADIYNCNPKKFTRHQIRKFFNGLCEEINMEPCKIAWWDYKDYPEEYEKAPNHLKGTSAVQFISTSNITIHTLDVLKRVYLNVFSCKDFDSDIVLRFAEEFFEGETVNHKGLDRI